MREVIEFRIPEENAGAYLPAGTGEAIGYGVRKVLVDTSDPLFFEIGGLERAFRAQNRSFHSGWEYRRSYSRTELEKAELFHIWPKKFFEPAGEECGTVYDETSACDHIFAPESEFEVAGHKVRQPPSTCGVGARPISPLFLDGRRIPRNVDFASTIANEVVVSSRVVGVFKESALSGAEFHPVRLVNKGGAPSENHFQLKVSSRTVEVHPKTRAGEGPFDDTGYGRCPRGHIIGLNLLSEVTVSRQTVPNPDVMGTKQMVGVRSGLLRPRPILLISPQAWRTIRDSRLRGLAVEVARLA